jgi:hypothetical protein
MDVGARLHCGSPSLGRRINLLRCLCFPSKFLCCLVQDITQASRPALLIDKWPGQKRAAYPAWISLSYTKRYINCTRRRELGSALKVTLTVGRGLVRKGDGNFSNLVSETRRNSRTEHPPATSHSCIVFPRLSIISLFIFIATIASSLDLWCKTTPSKSKTVLSSQPSVQRPTPRPRTPFSILGHRRALAATA